jgi:hypothetical protein
VVAPGLRRTSTNLHIGDANTASRNKAIQSMNSNNKSQSQKLVIAESNDEGTQYEYQWNISGTQLINEWRIYHQEYLMVLDKLQKNGPDNIEFPKKPKDSLTLLLGKERIKHTEDVNEIHAFLVKHIISDQSTMDSISDLGSTYNSPDDLLRIAQDGYRILKKQNSKALANYLDYGQILISAYEVWDTHVKRHPVKRQRITWKTWLKDNIGITDRYARELREMSRLFSGYPKIKQLGISFKELYNVKDCVSYHLETNEEFALLWQ